MEYPTFLKPAVYFFEVLEQKKKINTAILEKNVISASKKWNGTYCFEIITIFYMHA